LPHKDVSLADDAEILAEGELVGSVGVFPAARFLLNLEAHIVVDGAHPRLFQGTDAALSLVGEAHAGTDFQTHEFVGGQHGRPPVGVRVINLTLTLI
jgi:hypothetical protein